MREGGRQDGISFNYRFTIIQSFVVLSERKDLHLETTLIMPSTLAPTHRPFDRVQDHPLALHDDSNSLTSSHSLPSNPTDTHGSPRRPDHSQFISSSLPSPGKGHRKPVPRITSAELDDTLSQRHLSEDISRYPSTVTGHIGCATRDDRFADASGPYQMVPVDEYGVMIDLPKQLKMFSDRSRDPTVSSFEAFVLAPSTSSFTIFEKASVNKKGSREEVNGDGDGSLTEGKERKTPRSSPLKNQVKVSMESRRTITSTKASSDTIRSGATTIEVSHSSTKTKQSWNLFSRIENPNSARAEQSESSDQADPPTPSKPSPKSIITPKTQRHLRKLSVQPVSPFQIPPLSQNTESNKSPTRRSKAPHEGEKTPQITSRDMTPPASNKTIRSFSALHRASIDTPAMTQRGNGWSIPLLRVDDSPTKRKRVGTNARTLNDRYVAPSSHRITEDAIPLHNSGRIKLVAGNARNVSTTSNHGIPRVETRYLDDNDLVVRLEANERDHPVAETTQSEGDAMVGYWDYSIVTGVEGSPSRDYSMLLRNTGMLKQFVDLPSRVQNGMGINTSTSRTGKVAPDLIDEATTAPLPAPRSSSDKSLTCSSNYPDDTDDVSEHSPSNYDGKRRGRHTRRRENRPVSMASLATPLGEDAKAIEQARSVGQVVYDSRSVGVALPMGPDARINTPCESSFAQVRLGFPDAIFSSADWTCDSLFQKEQQTAKLAHSLLDSLIHQYRFLPQRRSSSPEPLPLFFDILHLHQRNTPAC